MAITLTHPGPAGDGACNIDTTAGSAPCTCAGAGTAVCDSGALDASFARYLRLKWCVLACCSINVTFIIRSEFDASSFSSGSQRWTSIDTLSTGLGAFSSATHVVNRCSFGGYWVGINTYAVFTASDSCADGQQIQVKFCLEFACQCGDLTYLCNAGDSV